MTEPAVFPTGESPEITITSVSGDLRLTGWEQNQFLAESDDETLIAEQKGDAVAVVCHSDCAVRVPHRSRVKILQVGGDARIKTIESPITVESVAGDLVLRTLGDVDLGKVGGDVSAKKIQGGLRVKFAAGDLSARGVAGDFLAEAIGGDLYLRDVGGDIRAQCRADVILNVEFTPEHEYEIKAGGDLACRLLPGASAAFAVKFGGDLSVDVLAAKVTGSSREKTVTLGDGAARASLQASGDVSLSALTGDPEALGELGEKFGEDFGVMAEELSAHIGAQIESQLAQFEQQLNARLAGLGAVGGVGVNAEDISERVRRATERAADTARRKAEAARRRAQSKIQAGQRRAERHAAHAVRGKHAAWSFPTSFTSKPFTPPAPPSEPITDEERLSILRMVEQGKISVAEAEKLLAALEGN